MSFRHPADWSRRLPRPLVILKVMTLTTLADVRSLMRNPPADHRNRSTWQHVAAERDEAARGGADVADVAIALRIALMLEHIECRPR